jgi:hypothetical protein
MLEFGVVDQSSSAGFSDGRAAERTGGAALSLPVGSVTG